MSDQNIELADLLKDTINAADLGATAERDYLPLIERTNVHNLTLLVIPQAEESESFTRKADKSEFRVDVGVLKGLSVGSDNTFDKSELDGLMQKVRDLKDALKRQHLGTDNKYKYRRYINDPIYSREHLEQHRQFTSVVTFVYELVE